MTSALDWRDCLDSLPAQWKQGYLDNINLPESRKIDNPVLGAVLYATASVRHGVQRVRSWLSFGSFDCKKASQKDWRGRTGPRCALFITYCTMAFRLAGLLPGVQVHSQELPMRMEQIKGCKKKALAGGQYTPEAWLNLGTWREFVRNLDELQMVRHVHIAAQWYVGGKEFQKQGVMSGHDVTGYLEKRDDVAPVGTPKKKKTRRKTGKPKVQKRARGSFRIFGYCRGFG